MFRRIIQGRDTGMHAVEFRDSVQDGRGTWERKWDMKWKVGVYRLGPG